MEEGSIMENDYISEDEFRDDWGVIKKSNGEMFDYDEVKNQPLQYVWAIIDTGDYEDENLYASPGIHIVNQLGFIMTKRAWTDDTPDAIYYLHEDIDDGSRTVFLYQYHDASGHKTDGVLLLFGESDGIENDLIRESCNEQAYFVAEQVGVPALCDELYAFSDGSTRDDHASHKLQGLREATAEEEASLPLWGSLRELTCHFLKAYGQ